MCTHSDYDATTGRSDAGPTNAGSTAATAAAAAAAAARKNIRSDPERVLQPSPPTGAASAASAENRSDLERHFSARPTTLPDSDAPGEVGGADAAPPDADQLDADQLDADQLDVADRVAGIRPLLFRWELGTAYRLTALAGRLELTLRELLVLSELSRRPTGLVNAQICGIVGLPSATVAELVRDLERRGLVDRGPDPFDRRQVNSGITDSGRRLLERREPSDREIGALLYGVRPDQIGAVTSFLRLAGDRGYEGSRRLRERAPVWW